VFISGYLLFLELHLPRLNIRDNCYLGIFLERSILRLVCVFERERERERERMVGALYAVASSVVDSHSSPCLCLDALPSTNMNFKSGGDLVLQRNSMARKHFSKPGSVELSSSFIDSGRQLRLSKKALSGIVHRSSRKQRKERRLVIVNELAGQYEDSFEDVKTVRKLILDSNFSMNFLQEIWWYILFICLTQLLLT
jgi:hypothetical protein